MKEFLKDLLLAAPYLPTYGTTDWTILGLTAFGIVLSFQNRIHGLAVIATADLCWAFYDFALGEYAQGFLFLFYSAVTAWGCYSVYKSCWEK